jgi:hypothetical protein
MTFKQIYERILRSMEYDPATWTGSAAEQEHVAQSIEWRARMAWEKTMWSRLVETAEFAVTTDSDDAKYVAYGSGVDTLSAVWQVSTRNPRASRNPGRLSFLLSPRGVELTNLAGATVWIQYRPRHRQFTRVAYSGAATYAIDDVVYSATTGECYRSIVGSNTGQAVTDATKWEAQTLPDFLAEYICRAAFSDLLRNDGRGDRADVEEARAEFELERVLNVEETQQDQHRIINARIP